MFGPRKQKERFYCDVVPKKRCIPKCSTLHIHTHRHTLSGCIPQPAAIMTTRREMINNLWRHNRPRGDRAAPYKPFGLSEPAKNVLGRDAREKVHHHRPVSVTRWKGPPEGARVRLHLRCKRWKVLPQHTRTHTTKATFCMTLLTPLIRFVRPRAALRESSVYAANQK